jgi:hypothetical protein
MEQRRHLGIRQIGDGGQFVGRGLGERGSGRVAVRQFENPGGGDILGEQSQFGEGQGQEMMELVEDPSALADDGLESAGDLAEDAEFK